MNELFGFLRELNINNNREWFATRKKQYQPLREQWIAELDRFILAMAAHDDRYRFLSGKEAAYRIYRDTRFSPDKTPYKPFLSASFNPFAGARCPHHAGVYIHVSPANPADTGIFGGIWQPEAKVLKQLRRDIIDNIDEWEQIHAAPEIVENGFEVTTTRRLKTAPMGWPKDHPQIKWLQMTDFGLWKPLSPEFFLDPEWSEKLVPLALALNPYLGFINYSVEEATKRL